MLFRGQFFSRQKAQEAQKEGETPSMRSVGELTSASGTFIFRGMRKGLATRCARRSARAASL